jgi:gamma-glutamylcyclotransferase (GGCT)/AIG2-like uncharacterized protein YtfP
MTRQLLFVYGTLKRGQFANHMLADGRFVGTVVTEPLYQLIDLGTHPGLVSCEQSGVAVKGELWEIGSDIIPALDRYEGAPTAYERREIRIQNCQEPVIAYFFLGDGTTLPTCGSEWVPAGQRAGR